MGARVSVAGGRIRRTPFFSLKRSTLLGGPGLLTVHALRAQWDEAPPGTPRGSVSSVNDCFNELCSSDPEVINVNPHITLSLLRFLFPVFQDAATALGIDSQRSTQWLSDKSSDYPTILI